MKTNINYYEFNDAPYYALIMATNTFEALKAYEENVCEIQPDEDVLPDELNEEEALTKVSNTPVEEGRIEPVGVDSAKEMLQEYKEIIESKASFGELLLIDGSLL